MNCNYKIDILTTLIPEKRNDDCLIEKNPILNLTNNKNYNFIIFNNKKELPKNSTFNNFISKEYNLKEKNRPNLKDYYSDQLTDWIIICNSDIIFFCDIKELINECDKNQVGFATSRRYDVNYLDLFLNNYYKKINFKKHLKNYSKLQSRRTLDFFLIKKTVLNAIINFDKDNLKPGTILFDIKLFIYGSLQTKIADISNSCLIIHKNHEDFRIASPLNIMTSLHKRENFVKSRKIKINTNIIGGCLTYADYTIKKGYLRKNLKFLSKYKYKLESIRIKIINKIEILLFYWNKLMFSLNLKILKKNRFKFIRFFNLIILMPSPFSFAKENIKKSITLENYVKERYQMFLKNKNLEI